MLNPIFFAIGSTILLLLTVLWHYMLRGIIVDSSDTVTVYYSLSLRVLITVCTLFLDFLTFYRQGTIMVYKTPFVKLLWIVLLSFFTVVAMESWTFFVKIKKEEGCLVYRSCSLTLKCQSVQLSNITKIDLYNRNGIVITYMNHQHIKKLTLPEMFMVNTTEFIAELNSLKQAVHDPLTKCIQQTSHLDD